MTEETLIRAQQLRRYIHNIEHYLQELDKVPEIIKELTDETTPELPGTGIRIIVEGMATSVNLLVGIDKVPDMENLIAGIREQVVKDLEATKTEFENL